MPKIFGVEHILYLVFWVLFGASTLYLIVKKVRDEKTKDLIVKLVGILLLLAIAYNRISIAVVGKNIKYLLPDSFCGTSSLAFALAIIFLKKDNIVLHCVAYFGFVGGILTLAYPDFIGQNQSIFYSKTISGLLHHTLMVYLFLLIILTGYFKPNYKKYYAVVLGGTCYMTYGLFLIKVVGLSNAMIIEKPLLDGTIFYWYTVAVIFFLAYSIFITLWEIFKKPVYQK